MGPGRRGEKGNCGWDVKTNKQINVKREKICLLFVQNSLVHQEKLSPKETGHSAPGYFEAV